MKWKVQLFRAYQGNPMDSVGENNNEEFMREGTRRIKRAERRSLILCLGLEITT